VGPLQVSFAPWLKPLVTPLVGGPRYLTQHRNITESCILVTLITIFHTSILFETNIFHHGGPLAAGGPGQLPSFPPVNPALVPATIFYETRPLQTRDKIFQLYFLRTFEIITRFVKSKCTKIAMSIYVTHVSMIENMANPTYLNYALDAVHRFHATSGHLA